MAAHELYDYLSAKTPDKDVTLSIAPQAVVSGTGHKEVAIHMAVDGSAEERINMSGSGVICHFGIKYNLLNASDAGTVMQFWYDTDYGNGPTNSFKFNHAHETAKDTGHTYVVRWDCDFERLTDPRYVYTNPVLRLRVLGVIAD